MIALSVLVDYRPVSNEWYVLNLAVPVQAEQAPAFHEDVEDRLRWGRSVVVVDVDGAEWSFVPETVRAFRSRAIPEGSDP